MSTIFLKNSSLSHTNVKFSIMPLKIIIFLITAGPSYGIYVSFSQQKPLLGLIADENLILNYNLYFAVITLFLFTIKSEIAIRIKLYNKRQIRKIGLKLLALAIIVFISIFLFSGIYTLTGNLGRGEVRVNTGVLGPFYALSLKYFSPLISIISSIILYDQRRYFLAWTCYVILIICGFMTGGKAITIFIMLSTACYFWPKINFLHKILIAIIAIATIVISHSFFTQRQNITITESLNYNFIRATEIAAYGLLASWDYSKTSEIDKIYSATRSVFGDQITSSLFTSTSSNQVSMDWDIAKLITYHYYPNWSKAQDGTTNLTRTIFADFILFFKNYWIIGFLIFLFYLYLVFKFMLYNFSKGHLILGVITFIYINMTVIPIINSGGIFLLISVPILSYYTVLFFLLKFYLFK